LDDSLVGTHPPGEDKTRVGSKLKKSCERSNQYSVIFMGVGDCRIQDKRQSSQIEFIKQLSGAIAIERWTGITDSAGDEPDSTFIDSHTLTDVRCNEL
jgi:hypothetical protein